MAKFLTRRDMGKHHNEPLITSLLKPSCSTNLLDIAPKSNELLFTESNKMSLFSLEKRIDFHLSRIMKGHRLVNFKNSLGRLSTEDRICECILEVMVSKSLYPFD